MMLVNDACAAVGRRTRPGGLLHFGLQSAAAASSETVVCLVTVSPFFALLAVFYFYLFFFLDLFIFC